MAEPRFGTVPAEQAAAMSGRELLEGIVAGRLPMPTIGRTLTFRLVEVGEGNAGAPGMSGAGRGSAGAA